MLIFIFLAMNVKYCLTINPVMWFRFMGEDFNILPAWHVDQSVKYSARGNDSNLLIVFYVQIMPDDLVMQLHRF